MAIFEKYTSLSQYYRAKHEINTDLDLITTEKIDGTSARFGYVNGKYVVGSRNMQLDIEGGEGQHFGFLGYYNKHLKTILALLVEQNKAVGFTDIVFYSEFYGPDIAHAYTGEKQLAIYDVKVDGEWCNWDDVVSFASCIDTNTVPLLYRGPYNEGMLSSLKGGPSTLNAGIKREGIVIKPFTPRRDSHGEPLIIKLKPPENDEVATREPKAISGEDSLARGYRRTFIEHYVTANRLQHVIQQLREQGHLCRDKSDTGNVLRQMSLDVEKEGNLPAGSTWGQVAKDLTITTKNLYAAHILEEESDRNTKAAEKCL